MIFVPRREKQKRPPGNPLSGVALFLTVLLGLYAVRLYNLQVLEYQKYTTMSKDNRLQPRSLRAVRGEMLVLHSREVQLSRPVRLLHPRFPLYIVPRGDGRFMLGATMLESDDPGPITARSMMELLAAAVTVHPGFAEASVVATGVGLRPAFADNVPRLVRANGVWHLNGLYRHGFLAAPALAQNLVENLEVCHAAH